MLFNDIKEKNGENKLWKLNKIWILEIWKIIVEVKQ